MHRAHTVSQVNMVTGTSSDRSAATSVVSPTRRIDVSEETARRLVSATSTWSTSSWDTSSTWSFATSTASFTKNAAAAPRQRARHSTFERVAIALSALILVLHLVDCVFTRFDQSVAPPSLSHPHLPDGAPCGLVCPSSGIRLIATVRRVSLPDLYRACHSPCVNSDPYNALQPGAQQQQGTKAANTMSRSFLVAHASFQRIRTRRRRL